MQSITKGDAEKLLAAARNPANPGQAADAKRQADTLLADVQAGRLSAPEAVLALLLAARSS